VIGRANGILMKRKGLTEEAKRLAAIDGEAREKEDWRDRAIHPHRVGVAEIGTPSPESNF
jgi:hypothetical protein